MLPEQHRGRHAGDPTLGTSALTTFENGCLYAAMGYTLVVDPAVNPSDALHAHLELAATPLIDRGALLILGNDDFLLRLLRDRESNDAVQDYMAATLAAGQGLGIKVINAGGAAAFKANVRTFSLDDVVPYYGVSSRAIVLALQGAVHALGIPHPLHVHCNNLGVAGSADTALATMEAAERPADASRASPVLRLRYGGEARHLLGGDASWRSASTPPPTSPSMSAR